MEEEKEVVNVEAVVKDEIEVVPLYQDNTWNFRYFNNKSKPKKSNYKVEVTSLSGQKFSVNIYDATVPGFMAGVGKIHDHLNGDL